MGHEVSAEGNEEGPPFIPEQVVVCLFVRSREMAGDRRIIRTKVSSSLYVTEDIGWERDNDHCRTRQ
jgi:hypothetical protein